ncbi:beach domain-containing [Chlorella sorokiniana]|uniref:Beach domain-containing n=1 Tax=Chlorella sorokiniana TaxID=3076 RepID=A0A2P6TSN9_CHLSO|nr:beach domain-containing [Chlorella sorokiniana]|eukprot:PRW57088.1 beach domain-containing [Chlorella sorokiniana]
MNRQPGFTKDNTVVVQARIISQAMSAQRAAAKGEEEDLTAPFTRHDQYGILGLGPNSVWEKVRLAVLAVTVLPIKLTGALLALLSFWLCCWLSFLLPSSVRSDWVAKLGNWHCRVCLWWCGFWRVTWIKVGQQDGGGAGGKHSGAKAGSGGKGGNSSGSSSDSGAAQPVGIVSNHISWCDILIHMSHSFPSFVARSQTRRTPIIGIISQLMMCLYVDRDNKDPDAPRVSEAVVQRMQDMAAGKLPHARPLLLFPEGTTTNGLFLLPFKTGAFLAGLPLQPVVIRYGEGRFSPAWEMIPAARHIFLIMANPVHSVTCFELPVYYPSPAEKADPKLYAANVRKLMMDFAGLQPTHATYHDKMALMKRLRQEHGLDGCVQRDQAAGGMSGEKKRPAEERPAAQGPAGKLGDLAQQIDYFESLAEQEGDQQDAKKPAKVHSLTQNTTHRKIRVGPEYQAAVRRFSLLLLEEGELYVEDFVATARWPQGLAGNWQRLPKLPGQLRVCTRSLFFEPDDVRVPIVRLPFQFVEGLEGSGDRRLVLTASRAIKMRANAADAPYVVAKAVAGGGGGTGAGGGSHAAHGQAQHPAGDGGAPYLFHWEFELSYARLEAVMPLAQQMMVASRLPPGEADDFLRATMAATEAGRQFDLGNLRSPGERILLEMGCTLLSQGALVREPGRLLLTDQRLYFQPLHPISGDAAVSSHPLTAVAAAARRRSSLRDLALEVFFAELAADASEGQPLAAPPFWAGASALFAFATREDRERAVTALRAVPALGAALPGGASAAAACSAILEADPTWLSRVTAAWQRGQLSNLDYLLFLNLASGRSFSDLSQYPVMPWVLSDYSSPALELSDPAAFRDLSRPVGALNPRRLDMLRERYREMASFSPEPPFLYGSHYSTPGFTMFWLVRAAPAHMLRLQNGRFDSPDRLFCSVREAWEGVTSSNPADVKELIPEFFLRHDFLRNLRGLALGTRQSGRPVGNVELPEWAAASPQRFLDLHRAALEAPFVSANLHHWIDLVFGHKQRGPAAEAADNVFRHTAYEGAVDLDAVADRTERLALETQIAEFGQCPRQLFHAKHPQRLVCPPPPEQPAGDLQGTADVGAGSSGSQALPLALVATILAAAERGQGESPRLEVSPLLAQLDVMVARRQAEEEAAAAAAAATAAAPEAAEAAGSESVNSCALATVGQQLFAYSASHSGSLRVHSVDSGEQARSINLCEQPLTAVALLQPSSSNGSSSGPRHPLALCGAFDARVHAYSADTGRKLGSFQAADDTVACVQVVGSASGSRLLTAAWDGSLKLWEAAEGREPWAASFSQPLSSAAAPSGVWALAASPEGHTVVAGTEDGVVAAWDWRQPPRPPLWQLQLVADGGYVGGLALCPGGTAAVAAAADGSLSLLDLRRSGEVAASVVPAGAPLRCCATDGHVAVAGDEGGALHLWDVSAQLGQSAPAPSGAWTPPDPAGLFQPALVAQPRSAINALAVASQPGGAAGLVLVTAHEGGVLRVYTT